MIVLGLDISKLSATYCVLDRVPDDPKHWVKTHKPRSIQVNADGRDELLSLDFDFAVLEPTGVYSRIWRHWLTQAGKEYRMVGHAELKSYREGWKLASKTDRLDSFALALYGIERRERPGAFLVERDTTLSDLVLLHSHLNRQKNGFQNNLRSRLSWQLPECYKKQLLRKWGTREPPGLLQAIAGEPSAYWLNYIQQSCGVGLDDSTAAIARILIKIEDEEGFVEQLIDTELSKPCYVPYLRAAAACEFSRFLTVNLIAAVFPFEQFLEGGKRRILHTTTNENHKRVRRDDSLRSFKLACGLGLIWVQSGDWEGWTAGGSGAVRQALRNAIAIAYLNSKKTVKRGKDGDELILSTVKSKYDTKGIMKVARKWAEWFYSELVSQFNA